jgi:hypothetical protein
MMAEPNDTPEPEPEVDDDGPIELPVGASCATCAYSFTLAVPTDSVIAGAKSTREARFCKRFPPNAVVIPQPNGSFAIVGNPVPVGDEYVCFEYDIAALNLLGN